MSELEPSVRKREDGAPTFWTDYFEIRKEDPSDLARTFFWILDTHVMILRLFERILRRAIDHDPRRWQSAWDTAAAELEDQKRCWKQTIETRRG